MALASFKLDDPLDRPHEGAVEVTITLDSGEARWCFFMTPDRLAQVGDYVSGTRVRAHYDAPHMIVVSELSEDIIGKVLGQLDSEGALERCSKPLE